MHDVMMMMMMMMMMIMMMMMMMMMIDAGVKKKRSIDAFRVHVHVRYTRHSAHSMLETRKQAMC